MRNGDDDDVCVSVFFLGFILKTTNFFKKKLKKKMKIKSNRFDPSTGLLGMSFVEFKYSELKPIGRLIVLVLKTLRLVSITEVEVAVDKSKSISKPTTTTTTRLTRSSQTKNGISKKLKSDDDDDANDDDANDNSDNDNQNNSKKVNEEPLIRMNNLTIINFVIRLIGPHQEGHVTIAVLGVQVFCSLIAFFIRYQLVKLVYDN